MKMFIRMFYSILVFLAADMYGLFITKGHVCLAVLLAACFAVINIMPSFYNRKRPTGRLRICGDGCELLLIFLISTMLSSIYLIAAAFLMFPNLAFQWFISLLIVVIMEVVVFWNGIIRVYLTSLQLGVKWRIIGIVCGLIPLAHLIVLSKIIRIALRETNFESEKILLDKRREQSQICHTKYPLLFVHGVFFRDFKYLNYWGRIPDELKKNGAVIYYGNHQSAASVVDSGKELSERIRHIIEKTGCEKINIIAHSKGGLDCRYAISKLGMAIILLLLQQSIRLIVDASLLIICFQRFLRTHVTS